MKRPQLNSIDLKAAKEHLQNRHGIIVTVAPGAWNMYADVAYEDGGLILEVNHREEIVAAFKRSVQ